MPSDHLLTTIGEICDVFDGPHATPPKTDRGPVFLGISCLQNGRIDLTQADHVAEEDFVKWTRRVTPKHGDVVFSYETRLGEAALVPKNLKCCLGRRMGLLRPKRDDVDARFLLYSYLGPEFQETLRERTIHGSTVDRIPLVELPDFPIRLPKLSEQRRIAHILGTLDDKIELNRRMNETLEAMARALFKSWFVDFDPVRAKAEGRDPGLPKHIADLFPDSFEDSPLGRIPAGWRVELLEQHISAVRGLSYKGSGLSDSAQGVPLHNLNSVFEGGGYKHAGIKYYTGAYKDKHRVSPGDMIVTNTEQGFDALLIGHAAIVPPSLGSEGIFSHHLYRVRPKTSSPFNAHYLVELFNTRRWHNWIAGFANGTTINMLPLDAMQLPQLVVPPRRLIEAYSQAAEAIHLRTECVIKESRAISSLRDLALPSLMNGNSPN